MSFDMDDPNTILDRVLLPYQRAWVADDSRFKIGLWSRQTGKSFATACEASLDCLLRPGQLWVVLSAGERQALEWMRKAKVWAEAFRLVADSYEETRASADATLAKAEIAFKNGSRIVAIPANPDTARGYSANLVLDEFAIHEKTWDIWAAIFPSITSPFGGEKKLRIVSTPKGLGNKFADLWTKCPGYSKHKTTIEDAVRQGLSVDLEALRESVDDADTWAQEYLCEFIDASGVLLPYETIAACEAQPAEIPEDAPRFVGMDVGRSHDLSVLVTLAEVGGLLVAESVRVLEKMPFAEQLAELAAAVRPGCVRHACVDATGIGAMLAEEARRTCGSRVEPVVFTHAAKGEMYTEMRRRFEEKSLRIPPDRALREDLHAVEKRVSSAGDVSYRAARASDGHSDRAAALALAIRAARRRGIFVPPFILGRRSAS